jgi:hypothetical protein
MNIEQIKQQYAELVELDKQRTQGEWVVNNNEINILKDNCPIQTYWVGYLGVGSDENFKCNIQLMFQAPAMFKMIGELIARVEMVEKLADINFDWSADCNDKLSYDEWVVTTAQSILNKQPMELNYDR